MIPYKVSACCETELNSMLLKANSNAPVRSFSFRKLVSHNGFQTAKLLTAIIKEKLDSKGRQLFLLLTLISLQVFT